MAEDKVTYRQWNYDGEDFISTETTITIDYELVQDDEDLEELLKTSGLIEESEDVEIEHEPGYDKENAAIVILLSEGMGFMLAPEKELH